MVQWQLQSVDHLMSSSFGCPFPRHGLQLLFWFANECVTCELINLVIVMKLVSDCQPEKGFCGFHPFGNFEELLPVLDRSRKGRKRQVAYFEVGNLNTETCPASANLPMYVRENYGLDGNHGIYNIDRIIISFQLKTRVVETVFVTEHDGVSFGGFSPDRTYGISSELLRALQSPQLDLTTFLTQAGYVGDDAEEILYPEPDYLQFFTDAFNQQLDNIVPFSYNQQVHHSASVTPYNSRLVANYSGVQHKHKKPKANERQKPLRQSYWLSAGEQPYKGFNEDVKKRNGGGGGGVSFLKILLGAGDRKSVV